MRTSLLEVISAEAATLSPDEDVCHYTCHCTDATIAGCGLNVGSVAWDEVGEDPECALCVLAWSIDPVRCPWGCSCDEECGPVDPPP